MYFDNLVITFFIYSFMGYICEVIYCSVGQRRLVNRGFLYGPCLPIYGFGGLIIKLCLSPLVKFGWLGVIAIFLLGMVLTSIVEYIGSLMLEKWFGIKLWDYSRKFCNINGRVCLLNSTLFGIMGLVAVYIVEPYLNQYIAMLGNVLDRVASDIIIVCFVTDFILSSVKMSAFKNALKEVREKSIEMEERTKALINEHKTEAAIEVRKQLDAALERARERARKHSRRIIAAFPSATSPKAEVREQLERLKKVAEESRAQLAIKKASLKGKGNDK